jgi:predicted dehydrogenase
VDYDAKNGGQMDKIRWGILGTGKIATQSAKELMAMPDAELVAVGSRSQSRADDFGYEFDVPRRHASYAAVTNDPDVPVVYVATPHSFHRENSILCLEGGKAVRVKSPSPSTYPRRRKSSSWPGRKGFS